MGGVASLISARLDYHVLTNATSSKMVASRKHNTTQHKTKQRRSISAFLALGRTSSKRCIPYSSISTQPWTKAPTCALLQPFLISPFSGSPSLWTLRIYSPNGKRSSPISQASISASSSSLFVLDAVLELADLVLKLVLESVEVVELGLVVILVAVMTVVAVAVAMAMAVAVVVVAVVAVAVAVAVTVAVAFVLMVSVVSMAFIPMVSVVSMMAFMPMVSVAVAVAVLSLVVGTRGEPFEEIKSMMKPMAAFVMVSVVSLVAVAVAVCVAVCVVPMMSLMAVVVVSVVALFSPVAQTMSVASAAAEFVVVAVAVALLLVAVLVMVALVLEVLARDAGREDEAAEGLLDAALGRAVDGALLLHDGLEVLFAVHAAAELVGEGLRQVSIGLEKKSSRRDLRDSRCRQHADC